MAVDKDSPEERMLRAAYRGRLDHVEAAISDGADVNIMPDDIGLSALHMAIGRGHFDIVKYLMNRRGLQFNLTVLAAGQQSLRHNARRQVKSVITLWGERQS